ncbi:MAG TPA: DUF29 domain-containing protein [Oscillatoriaceae cyanobacterium M33_DOE_052]|uniref:DUF29 domain-containing protein n=1 Tax=Planktothricoides sp. SpSt-374 TaxID=2282167 RepID=A0A7C3VJS4_9CYAN|nr:DUF29 domain-containing protein [Oscillatoriaceae cyanobacterium M33_DOE_052]
MTAISETIQTNAGLYTEDYYLWLQQNLELLRLHKFNDVDWENLLEEIADMGKSEKRAITSNLRILLMHLLKYKYQTDKPTNTWLFTIREHRKRLREALTMSHSLKIYSQEVFAESYQDARELAADETGVAINTFPADAPFTPEDAINPDYLP